MSCFNHLQTTALHQDEQILHSHKKDPKVTPSPPFEHVLPWQVNYSSICLVSRTKTHLQCLELFSHPLLLVLMTYEVLVQELNNIIDVDGHEQNVPLLESVSFVINLILRTLLRQIFSNESLSQNLVKETQIVFVIFIHIFHANISDINIIRNTTCTNFTNYENLVIAQLIYYYIYIIFIQIKLHLFITHFIKPIKKTSRKDPLQSRHCLNCLQALQHIANLVVTSCWNVLINVFICRNMQSHFVLS